MVYMPWIRFMLAPTLPDMRNPPEWTPEGQRDTLMAAGHRAEDARAYLAGDEDGGCRSFQPLRRFTTP